VSAGEDKVQVLDLRKSWRNKDKKIPKGRFDSEIEPLYGKPKGIPVLNKERC